MVFETGQRQIHSACTHLNRKLRNARFRTYTIKFQQRVRAHRLPTPTMDALRKIAYWWPVVKFPRRFPFVSGHCSGWKRDGNYKNSLTRPAEASRGEVELMKVCEAAPEPDNEGVFAGYWFQSISLEAGALQVIPSGRNL